MFVKVDRGHTGPHVRRPSFLVVGAKRERLPSDGQTDRRTHRRTDGRTDLRGTLSDGRKRPLAESLLFVAISRSHYDILIKILF